MHLLAELDFAAVEVHEDVHVEGVNDLVCLAKEFLVRQGCPRLVLDLPLGDVDFSLKQVLVAELFRAGLYLQLVFISLVFVKR